MWLSFKRLGKSFRDASRGVVHTFRSEQNFRLQIIFSILVLILSFYFPLRRWERILVLLLIFSVLSTELLNTAVEKFCDLLVPRMHLHVSIIKDAMAAAVLITSIGAGIIGLFIFWPYLVN